MSIQLVTGFLVNSAEKLDNRIVASGSAARNAIPYKYEGLRVFDTFNNRSYYWNGTSFDPEITDQVNGSTNYVPKFTSQYYIGNSNIYIDSYKVGINTNSPTGDYTYLQLGGTNISEDPNYFSGQSQPLVIHKGGSTTIGNNWYYNGSEQAFNTSKGSTTMTFDGLTGDISFKIRQSGNTFANQKQGLYISQLGRVGIGNNFGPSSPPNASLDVTGSIISSANISANNGTVYAGYVTVNSAGSSNRPSQGIVIYDTTPNVSISLPPVDGNGLFIDWAANVPGDINYYAGILGYSKGINGGDLRFYTTNRGDISQPASVGSVTPNSTYRPVRMTILNTGNVGIGTTTPSTLLQVTGTVSAYNYNISEGGTISSGTYSKFVLTGKDVFANVHRISGAGTASYLNPTIASGEYQPSASSYSSGISGTSNVRIANWMRVGNVVSVSGQLNVTTTTTGVQSFELSLPVPANFYTGSTYNNSWRLNGVGAMITSTLNIAVRITGNSNATTNRAKFIFYSSGSQTLALFYTFQYNQDVAEYSGVGPALDPVGFIPAAPSL